MPQSLFGASFKNPNTNALAPASLDATATSALTAQGLSSALNIAAAKVIKVGAGRVVRIVLLTATAITINDCATTGAAGAANEIYTGTSLTAGSVITLDFPFSAGLVVSAITGTAAISYT